MKISSLDFQRRLGRSFVVIGKLLSQFFLQIARITQISKLGHGNIISIRE